MLWANGINTQEVAVTVQDTCLLSMLRMSAECDQIPHTVPKLVTEIFQFSGKRIRNVSPVAVWMKARDDLPISGVACS
jgi:hypothetical protein